MFPAPFESTLCIVIHDWNQCQQNHTELIFLHGIEWQLLLGLTAVCARDRRQRKKEFLFIFLHFLSLGPAQGHGPE
jgi:hypothetical protein